MHTLIICAHILSVQLYHHPMARKAARRDLAEMLAELGRQTVAAEMPVLAAHGLSMWGYIVLLALDRSPIRTQAALAEAIGADKTRIIPTLDELQSHGHSDRMPGPGVKDAVQAGIQRGEEQWPGQVSASERDVFLRVLDQLSRRGGD